MTVGISWYMGDRKYYIASVLIMIYSMIPFFAGFESTASLRQESWLRWPSCAL